MIYEYYSKALENAEKWAKKAIENAEQHLGKETAFYSRNAVAYMQLSDIYVAEQEYEKALPLINDAYNIMFSLFGEEDPDTVNVASSKTNVLYHLGRYSEAYALGKKNLEGYNKFSGELNYLRFEQLVIVFKCCLKVGTEEEIQQMRGNVIAIGEKLLSKDSKQLKELMEL